MDEAYLVTGATGGVGQAVVRELSEKGEKVVILARNKAKLDEMKAETANIIFCIAYDLEDNGNMEEIFRKCDEQGVLLKGLVHCAGINLGMPIKINDSETMNRMMRVNLYSFVELGKYFSKKKYAADAGSIVAISSMAAMENAKGMCMYSATKAALNSVVKTMAKELISRKICVNAIMPGYLEKPMTDEKYFLTEDKLREIQPLGRIDYSDVAKLVAFLLSKNARYITGALIPIGGGQI